LSSDGTVIKGWDEGIDVDEGGGKRLSIIPPGLGYGAVGSRLRTAQRNIEFDIGTLRAVHRQRHAPTARDGGQALPLQRYREGSI
jgi:hypothetical protein